MGRILELLKRKYSKKQVESEDLKRKISVRTRIDKMCEEYLEDISDVLRFQVLESDLPYAVMVLNEEPLSIKYDIWQVSDNCFEAKLKGVEF